MLKGTWRRARRGAADLTSIWFSGTRSEALHLRPWLSQGVLLLVPKSQHSCHFLTVTGVGGYRLEGREMGGLFHRLPRGSIIMAHQPQPYVGHPAVPTFKGPLWLPLELVCL